jgi:hypothetical protein
LTTKITAYEAECVKELLCLPSLQKVSWSKVAFENADACDTISQAMAASSIDELEVVYHQSPTSTAIVLDVSTILKANHLQTLHLQGMEFASLDSATALSDALATSDQLHTLRLCQVRVHKDMVDALGKAICRPQLQTLDVEDLSASLFSQIGRHLKGATGLQALRWKEEFVSTDIFMDILNGCLHCSDLRQLDISYLVDWSTLHDQATANVVQHCRSLVAVRIFHKQKPKNVPSYPCDAFLAACQAHRVIEAVTVQPCCPWRCPDFVAELGRITDKNRETRVFRRKLQSIIASSNGRAVVARLLSTLQDKPHLLFLALTGHDLV